MLATILKSRQAEATTLAIIDTFASVKELARTIKALNNTETKEEQKGLLKRSGELIGYLVGSDMETSETETELELNFAVQSDLQSDCNEKWICNPQSSTSRSQWVANPQFNASGLLPTDRPQGEIPMDGSKSIA